MVKTKRRVSKKSVATVAAVKPAARVKQGACDSYCWLCWLFKLMIAIFMIMILFWLGFCLGTLSAEGPVTKTQPAMSTNGPVCIGLKDHSMDSALSDMTSALANKTGDDFDKEFLLQMTLHHEGAVDMAKMVLEKSNRDDLKKFAQGIIDVQSKEIDQMKAWEAAWFTVK